MHFELAKERCIKIQIIGEMCYYSLFDVPSSGRGCDRRFRGGGSRSAGAPTRADPPFPPAAGTHKPPASFRSRSLGYLLRRLLLLHEHDWQQSEDLEDLLN